MCGVWAVLPRGARSHLVYPPRGGSHSPPSRDIPRGFFCLLRHFSGRSPQYPGASERGVHLSGSGKAALPNLSGAPHPVCSLSLLAFRAGLPGKMGRSCPKMPWYEQGASLRGGGNPYPFTEVSFQRSLGVEGFFHLSPFSAMVRIVLYFLYIAPLSARGFGVRI